MHDDRGDRSAATRSNGRIRLTSKAIGRSGGGAAARATPQQDQFLLFLHTFSLKSVCVGGWHPPPPMGRRPPPPTGNPGSATESF